MSAGLSILVPAHASGGQVCKGITDVLLLLVHLDGIAAGHIAVLAQGNHMTACHLLEADGGNADVIAIHIQLHLLRRGNHHMILSLVGGGNHTACPTGGGVFVTVITAAVSAAILSPRRKI